MKVVSSLTSILAMMARLATPYLFAAFGGMISQHVGIQNFALEGMMLGGAYFGYFFTLKTGSILIGILAAIVFGMASGWLLAFVAIRFGVNQLVVALGMNTLYSGITGFGFRLMSLHGTSERLAAVYGTLPFGPLKNIPIIGPMLFDQNFLTYIIVIVFIFYAWYSKRTETGLSMRACGENPSAAQTAGINVFKYRYLVVIIAGAFAAVGGLYLTLFSTFRFAEDMTGGGGWIAIAAISLGQLHPIGIFFSCLLFGAATALGNTLQSLNIGMPSQVALMVPYILAIVALIISARKKGGSHGPAALGKPFMPNH